MSLSSPEKRFKAAVKVIQSLPKNGSFQPSHAMMLTFYGLYKQATSGACNISQPYMWDVVGRAKWDAWNKLGNMPQEQAMIAYVDELKQIIETMPHTENVQDFIETLGTFYELIDDDSPAASSPIASMMRGRFSPKRASPINGCSSEKDNLSVSAESSPSRTCPPLNDDSVVLNGDSSETLIHHNSTAFSHDNTSAGFGTAEDISCIGPVKLCDNDTMSSDGEEFCDTSDAEPSRPIVTAKRRVVSVCEADTVSLLPATVHISQPEESITDGVVYQGRCDDDVMTSMTTYATSTKNVEQIACTLARLQQDMNTVLTRLQTLETLSLQQTQILAARNVHNSTSLRDRSRWFPFFGLKATTVAFIVVWPLVVNFLLKQLAGRRRR